MPDVANVHAKLAFTCVYEKDHLPALPQEADVLFMYGRWLQKNNLLKQDANVYPEIARLYRIAAANGHYKANINLQNGITDGSFDGSIIEVLDLNDQLIKEKIPTGFYNMAYYIDHAYGYDKNDELALKYFRKSADMGSPAGQYYVGEKLAPDDMAPDVMRQLRLCAAEQGHAKAGMELGAHFQEAKKYAEAVKVYQLGAKAGHEIAAFALENGFLSPPSSNELHYLALEKDEERSRRYKAIGKVLGRYSYLKPTVEEIDDIVPLPPAKLPPWDGKLKWLTAHEANLAPSKPSDELIAKLAKAKGLDPASGMPLAQLKKAEVAPVPVPIAATTPERVSLGTLCRTGQPCPEAGLWLGYFEGQKYSHQLNKGQPMPTITASITRRNKLAQWLKGPEKMELAMDWQLEKYS